MAPYVILGVIAGEALYYTSVAQWLERACRTHPAIAIPFASILGMASPLCTFGTVPIVLQLLRAGVPVAPMAAFLSTSSLMNPQLMIITWGGLGPKVTMARLGAVLLFGLVFGAITQALPTRFALRAAVRQDEYVAKPRTPFTPWSFVKRNLRTLRFVGLYVILGIVLGAIIEVFVPGRWITAMFGAGGWYQILFAALLGVPLYACGGGVIPLVRAMLDHGMVGGAALAFLVAGPATRVAPLMAMATILRPLFVVGYVIFLLVFSVLVGLLYGLL